MNLLRFLYNNQHIINAKEETVIPESQSVSEKRILPSLKPCFAGLFLLISILLNIMTKITTKLNLTNPKKC
jgi:hypothetical protein